MSTRTAKKKISEGRFYGGQTAEDRRAERRERFLEAGLDLIGTEGYRRTTVRALAKKAGATDRYFYESFANQEALLTAVFDHCTERLRSAVVGALLEHVDEGDVHVVITAALDAFFAVVEDPRLTRVTWLEILGVSPTMHEHYTNTMREFALVLLFEMRRRFPDWGIDDERGLVLSMGLIGAINQAATTWLLTGYRASRQTMIEATAPIFVGLVGYLERESASHARAPRRRSRS